MQYVLALFQSFNASPNLKLTNFSLMKKEDMRHAVMAALIQATLLDIRNRGDLSKMMK